MPTPSILKSLRNRMLVALVLLGCVWYLPSGWLQYAFAKTVAASTEEIVYIRRDLNARGVEVYGLSVLHGIVTNEPDKPWWERSGCIIGPECTLIHLAALITPFAIRRLNLLSVLSNTFLTWSAIAILNIVRLRFYVYGSDLNWTKFWYHDGPLYASYVFGIGGAIAYYLWSENRASRSPDSGKLEVGAEGSSDGSALYLEDPHDRTLIALAIRDGVSNTLNGPAVPATAFRTRLMRKSFGTAMVIRRAAFPLTAPGAPCGTAWRCNRPLRGFRPSPGAVCRHCR